MRRFCSAVRYWSSVGSWNTSPMLRRTSSRCRTTSKPATVAAPAVGSTRVHSILMVVDLPAPLGPRKPKTSPAATSKSTPSTATRASYVFVRALTATAGFTFRTLVDMTARDRVHSAVAHLARAGFTDASAAQTALNGLGVEEDAAVVAALAASADPDLAVSALARIADTADDRRAF